MGLLILMHLLLVTIWNSRKIWRKTRLISLMINQKMTTLMAGTSALKRMVGDQSQIRSSHHKIESKSKQTRSLKSSTLILYCDRNRQQNRNATERSGGWESFIEMQRTLSWSMSREIRSILLQLNRSVSKSSLNNCTRTHLTTKSS